MHLLDALREILFIREKLEHLDSQEFEWREDIYGTNPECMV